MFDFDRYGFPTIRLAAVGVAVHFLPMTRTQFEFYLADHPSPGMDMNWYDQRLSAHPRIDPSSVTIDNYTGLFTTGVLPGEAQQLAGLFGSAGNTDTVVALPDAATWQAIFAHAVASPAVDLGAVRMNARISELARKILDRLAPVVDGITDGAPTLADQMFLRHGVCEIVEREPGGTTFGVIGYPSMQISTLASGTPDRPALNDVTRPQMANKTHGFRLVWRPA